MTLNAIKKKKKIDDFAHVLVKRVNYTRHLKKSESESVPKSKKKT